MKIFPKNTKFITVKIKHCDNNLLFYLIHFCYNINIIYFHSVKSGKILEKEPKIYRIAIFRKNFLKNNF